MKHSTQRLLSFAVSIALIFAALIVFLNFIKPAYDRAQATKAEELSNKKLLDEQQAKLEKVNAIVKAYQGNLESVKSVASLAFPEKRNEADVLNQISKIASKYGLAVQNLTVNTPGAKSVSQARAREVVTSSLSQVKPVGVLNVQLRVTSSYANFKLFLHDLETNIRIMDIAALAVAPVGKPSQDFYTFDLTVATYYQNP